MPGTVTTSISSRSLTTADRPAAARRATLLGVLAVACAAAWPVVEMFRLITGGRATVLYGDQALLDLQARRAWHLDLLVGPYSRYGWHHPGPALAYLLALPVRLLEPSGAGLHLGTVLVNGAAAVAVVGWVWRRHGARAAVLAAFAVDLLVVCVTLPVERYPWNPYLLVVPMLLFVVVWVDAVCGHIGALLWSAVLASYLAQSHVVAAPFPALLVLIAAVAAVVRRRRGLGLVVPQRGSVGGGALLVLAWVPPVVELWRDHPDNVTLLYRYARSPQPRPPLATAVHQVLDAITIVPFTFHSVPAGSDLLIARSNGRLAAGLVLLVVVSLATLLVARRRRVARPAWLIAAAAAATVIGAVVNSRAAPPLESYLVVWLAFVPVAVLLALGLALLAPAAPNPAASRPAHSASPALRSPGRGVLTVGLALLAIVGAIWTTGGDIHQPEPWSSNDPTVTAFTAAALPALHPSDHVIGVTIVSGATWPTAAGLVDQLVRHGRSTTVAPEVWTVLFGRERAPGRPVDATLELYDRTDVAAAAAMSGATVLASVGTEVLAISRP